MTLDEALRWLAGAGAVGAVSWFASWFLEGFTWWDNMQSKFKSLIILVLALLVGAGATAILQVPPDKLEPWLPYLSGAILIIIAWLGSQVAHRLDVKAR